MQPTHDTRGREDVSERLDIIPAEFFVHRHIHGKWVCRCCKCLVQETAVAQLIDGGIPAAGLVTHTLISRFVDHLPYYRQESINACPKVHTPRSTLATWSGQGVAALEPLFVAHKQLLRDNGRSAVATQALQHIAQIYRVERELAMLTSEERLAGRNAVMRLLWERATSWLQCERDRVPAGSVTAKALNYSLNAWEALTRHLLDGEVNVDLPPL